jgi:hypothetical protein
MTKCRRPQTLRRPLHQKNTKQRCLYAAAFVSKKSPFSFNHPLSLVARSHHPIGNEHTHTHQNKKPTQKTQTEKMILEEKTQEPDVKKGIEGRREDKQGFLIQHLLFFSCFSLSRGF